MPAIPSLGKWKEGYQKLKVIFEDIDLREASLGYISLCLKNETKQQNNPGNKNVPALSSHFKNYCINISTAKSLECIKLRKYSINIHYIE